MIYDCDIYHLICVQTSANQPFTESVCLIGCWLHDDGRARRHVKRVAIQHLRKCLWEGQKATFPFDIGFLMAVSLGAVLIVRPPVFFPLWPLIQPTAGTVPCVSVDRSAENIESAALYNLIQKKASTCSVHLSSKNIPLVIELLSYQQVPCVKIISCQHFVLRLKGPTRCKTHFTNVF